MSTDANGNGSTNGAGVVEIDPLNYNPFDAPAKPGLRSDAVTTPGGVIINLSTGLGGPGDKTQNVEVTDVRVLDQKERDDLFIGYGIIKNIVETYPDEFPWPMWTFSDKPDGDLINSEEAKLNEYLRNFRLGSLEDILRKTLIEARKDGSAYLLLGIDDGQDWDQPVDEDRILSIEWVKLLFHDELIRDEVDSPLYELVYDRKGDGRGVDIESDTAHGNSGQPNVNTDQVNTGIKIHKSRLWEFGGDLLPDSIRRWDPNMNHCSAIQSAFNGFAKAIQSLGYAEHMIANHVVFAYALNGVAALRHDPEGQQQLAVNTHSLNNSRSAAGVTCYDKELEDLKMITAGGYGGLPDLLNSILEYMVYETRMTRFKVLGTANQAGLGSEGRGLQNRLEHATRLEAWCKKHLKPFFEYFERLALKAKRGPTGGQLPREFGHKFPPTLQLTPLEIAELVTKYVESYDKAIANKTLTQAEAREALFSGDLFPLTPSPVLNEQYTKQLIAAIGKINLEEALNPPKPEPAGPGSPKGQLGQGKDGKQGQSPEKGQGANNPRSDDATSPLLKIDWNGYKVALQYLPHMIRHKRRLKVAYGYLENTRSDADKMACDVYVGNVTDSTQIWEVTQLNMTTGEFDEHKYMICFSSQAEAEAAYLEAMPAQAYGGIKEVTRARLEEQAKPGTAGGTRLDTADVLTDQEYEQIAASVVDKDSIAAALSLLAEVSP